MFSYLGVTIIGCPVKFLTTYGDTEDIVSSLEDLSETIDFVYSF